MVSESLTKHLLSLQTTQPYNSATQHPFLHAAGVGALPKARLALWLAQDRLYAAHAYPRFVGALIAKIPFFAAHVLASSAEQRNQRVLRLLVFALQNVVAEADFFQETAAKWGLELGEWRERAGTRAYAAEMARVGAQGSLEEGLVFLWAMEKVYLDAWSYVASLQRVDGSGGAASAASARTESQPTSAQPASTPDADPNTTSANRAVATLAANWTNADFVRFVDELRDLVDDLGVQRGTEMWARAEAVWDRVVELEVGFWPELDEEMKESARLK